MNKQVMQHLDQCRAAIGALILDKDPQIRLALTCLLARGHLLIEDLPGMGKTTLAHAIAGVFGLDWARVQFTSDLLPADLLGGGIYDPREQRFELHKGPVFTQVLLADELNRASPKAQSALLEAMEERQVSLDGETHALPTPFFVIATQNPREQAGTFALPESQLDRFLMRISLGYPAPAAERRLLMGESGREAMAELSAQMPAQNLMALQAQVPTVHTSDALLDYAQRLIAASRDGQHCRTGLSPRAALALINSARAHAMLGGRDHVHPEDLQTVFGPVCGHRLSGDADGDTLARRLLDAVDVGG